MNYGHYFYTVLRYILYIIYIFMNHGHFLRKDTFNKLGYKAKINTHTTSYIN